MMILPLPVVHQGWTACEQRKALVRLVAITLFHSGDVECMRRFADVDAAC